MADSNGFTREVAHRIFAAELKESNLQSKEGQDQYSPQYLITPTGAKCNRIFVVGTLTEKEDIGIDSEFWRGRIVDPTGAFYVTAGQYQPEAAQVLAKTAPPEFIAVIGKPSTFTTKEGNVLTSIRAESMHVVNGQVRDQWVFETARHTMARLEKLYNNIPSAFKARMHYSTNVDAYKAMVARVLVSANGADTCGVHTKGAEPLS
ncbi:MAG: DNA-binding protein [Candidatus Methanoperedens sp.]|nr:DNA-binding protein [Candidatus Methanoperedens sp.]